MTTLTEIRRWTRALLAENEHLVLVKRHVVIEPVRHMLRGIFIDYTSDQSRVQLHCHVAPLFAPPSQGRVFSWTTPARIPATDDPAFAMEFLATCRRVIDTKLARIDSIAAFLDESSKMADRAFGSVPVQQVYRTHGLLLAALGHFEEARAAFGPLKRDQLYFERQLEEGEALQARSPRRRIGAFLVRQASTNLAAIRHYGELVDLIEAKNWVAVGALLRQWEAFQVRQWEIEHLWTPTPFPLEIGMGG